MWLYCLNFVAMSLSDQFFFNIFNYYKGAYKKYASRIALIYIDLLQVSFLLVLGIFFSVFFRQMNMHVMSSKKAWILFVIAAIIICFKNWIQYSGKKRKVMNAKISSRKSKHYAIWILWILPIICLALSFILLQAF